MTRTDLYADLDETEARELARHIAEQGDEAGYDQATIVDARRRAAPEPEHRYVIAGEWGDVMEADTLAAAECARRQMAEDHYGDERNMRGITILDRGAPQR